MEGRSSMTSMNRWLQNDMSGGENQSVQPDKLADNEMFSMVNILPRTTERGYEVRTGFKSLGSLGSLGSPFMKNTITQRETIFAVENPRTSTGKIRCYGDLTDTADTIYDSKSVDKVWWSDWDGNRFLFSNGSIGLHTMLIDDIDGTNRATAVDDYGEGTSIISSAPAGKYLTQHGGRLFMVGQSGNGSWTTVHCCGSSDSVKPRYNSWSGLGASAGGSFDVTPYGTEATGLASTFGGLVIFKSDRIMLLTYPDASAPWNPVTGAMVETLNDGIGCVSHDSIDVMNDTVYFVGKSRGGKLGVYALGSSSVTPVSENIPEKMKSVLSSASAEIEGKVVDGFYILLARVAGGSGKRAVACLDLTSGAWSSFVTEAFSGITHHSGVGVLLTSPTGLYGYPSNVYNDSGVGIDWELVTKRVLGGSEDADAYWRIAGGRGGSNNIESFDVFVIDDNNIEHELSPVSLNDNDDFDAWDDGTLWTAVDYWTTQPSHSEFFSEIGIRSNGVQLKLSGTTTSLVYLDYLLLGYRDRRKRNWPYE
jgi:hypothetical protein